MDQQPWQYARVTWSAPANGWAAEGADGVEPASRPLPLLNVLGEQGWELVGFDPNDDGAYLLKRPAEFETEPTRPPRRIR